MGRAARGTRTSSSGAWSSREHLPTELFQGEQEFLRSGVLARRAVPESCHEPRRSLIPRPTVVLPVGTPVPCPRHQSRHQFEEHRPICSFGQTRITEPNPTQPDPPRGGCGPGGRGFESRRSPLEALQRPDFCVLMIAGLIRPRHQFHAWWLAARAFAAVASLLAKLIRHLLRSHDAFETDPLWRAAEPVEDALIHPCAPGLIRHAKKASVRG